MHLNTLNICEKQYNKICTTFLQSALRKPCSYQNSILNDCESNLLRSQIRACRRWEPWQTAEQQRSEQELQAKSVAKSVTAVSWPRSARTAPRFVSRLCAGAVPRRGGESPPPEPPFPPSNLASKGRRPARRRRRRWRGRPVS